MTEEIRRACRLAIDAGYRNIDIDSSTLVDLSKPNVDEQQRENYRARGGADRAHPDARARRRDRQRRRRDRRGRQGELDRGGAARLPRRLPARARAARARCARDQQGQRPDGHAPRRRRPAGRRRWPRSSSTSRSMRELGAVARQEYGLAGAVQHGASTLPDELFHRFPAVETAEIHLATGFQNALYEHPAFPAELHREIEAWCYANALDERKRGPDRPAVRLHDPQEGASGRSSASCGSSRRRTRSSRPRRPRSGSCSRELGSTARGAMVDRYVPPVALHRPMPEALGGGAAAAG